MENEVFYNRDRMYENIPNQEKRLIKDVEELKTNGIPDNQARQGVADLTETVGEQSSKIDVLSQYVSSIDRYPKLSGELDDSNRIERAINDLSVNYGGGKLLLGKETYIISKPLNFKSNIEIEGFGDATVIQASINSNTFAFINLVNISSSKLRNVKLDGKASARTLTSATGGIFITGSNNCLVENVTLTDFGFNPRGGNGGNFITVSAIEGQNSCYGNIVRNCRLIDSDGRSSFGIRLWTSWEENKEANQFTSLVRDNIIENNYISGFDWNSIELAGVATIENKIMGNSCENLYGYGFVEADKGSSYNVFAFNKCKKPMNTLPLFAFRDQGIPASTSPVYPARTCVGNQWIGNEAKGIVQNDSTTSGGFLAIRSRDCSVTNLKITDISTTTASNHNIAAIVINSDVENLMVTGGSAFNVKTGIYNNGGNNITISNFSINAIGYGYYSTAAVSKDITISNNTFKGGTTAINMSSEENILIIGNTIRDCSSVGIRFNNAKGSAIGNGISNTTNYGIDSRQADQSVQNNRLTGCIVYTVENVRNSVVGNFSDQDNSRARVRSYGSTMPSGGSWMKGDYVENTNITLQGTSPNKYVVKGWLRATTGNTHVLNTDWFEDRALTGT
jgi:Pectate lyase superfamily protein